MASSAQAPMSASLYSPLSPSPSDEERGAAQHSSSDSSPVSDEIADMHRHLEDRFHDIPSHERVHDEEEFHVLRVPKHYSRHRRWLHHQMESRRFQYFVIFLVLLDSLLVLIELFLDLHKKKDCTEEEHATTEPIDRAIEALHIASLVILGIFIVEICMKVYARGHVFFHHKAEVIDAVIVIVSFALDIIFKDEENAVSLIILLRLWRVARIIHGVVLTVEVQEAKKLRKEHHLRKRLQRELEELKKKIASSSSPLSFSYV